MTATTVTCALQNNLASELSPLNFLTPLESLSLEAQLHDPRLRQLQLSHSLPVGAQECDPEQILVRIQALH